MLSSNINQSAKKLTEQSSIELFNKIKFVNLPSNLSTQKIASSYATEGESDTPMVLLHGFDSSLLEYRRLFPLLTDKYQVWALDLFGFGFSDRTVEQSFSPEGIKTHLYNFWSKMINKPMILVGASMGGATAIDFCLTYPEAVDKLILLDSGGLTKKPIMSKFLFPPLGFLATEFLRNLKVRQSISETAYCDRTYANPDALICAALHLECENWNKALISFTKSGGYGSFASNLPDIKAETLVIWGKNDKILGTKPAHKFAQMIPHSKLIWIDNCGHVPHLEKAAITAQHILDFLE
ncbi:alpha/beta fold hydrolase [Cyanobacterium sp. IPPAS B-1200]|uniref:alpha/beta fold hydrolase n=1 Tax=Cyanobacterium sp. IPPAS B-1200 TaxID=1562720 RepID=UPI0008524E98|nr:alpha/beta hydrolase [Cyanobacterium sp. IPPAS B-1200]OEJ78638.1 2-hydroxy-6-oxohepta-2,4-dienoate hydrolase [Cyanobacterium sp. IPPAS B-1200]